MMHNWTKKLLQKWRWLKISNNHTKDTINDCACLKEKQNHNFKDYLCHII